MFLESLDLASLPLGRAVLASRALLLPLEELCPVRTPDLHTKPQLVNSRRPPYTRAPPHPPTHGMHKSLSKHLRTKVSVDENAGARAEAYTLAQAKHQPHT